MIMHRLIHIKTMYSNDSLQQRAQVFTIQVYREVIQSATWYASALIRPQKLIPSFHPTMSSYPTHSFLNIVDLLHFTVYLFSIHTV